MCGIVGYIGSRDASEFLVEGLKRLEYRGYDSAGIATVNGSCQFQVTKAVGRIQALADKLTEQPTNGSLGIGHTRWATHGPPNEENAHPHMGGNDCGRRGPQRRDRKLPRHQGKTDLPGFLLSVSDG